MLDRIQPAPVVETPTDSSKLKNQKASRKKKKGSKLKEPVEIPPSESIPVDGASTSELNPAVSEELDPANQLFDAYIDASHLEDHGSMIIDEEYFVGADGLPLDEEMGPGFM